MSRIFKAKTPSALANFSWVNQGSSAALDARGAIKLGAYTTGTGYEFHALQKSASRPFIVKAHISTFVGDANTWAGIHFSATNISTNFYGISLDSGNGIRVDQYYENAGSYIHSGLNASSSNAFWDLNDVWLKIEATSTTTAWFASKDGENWTSLYSTGSALPSNISHVGLFADPYNGDIVVEFDSFEMVSL